jgi:hypothetical protein
MLIGTGRICGRARRRGGICKPVKSVCRTRLPRERVYGRRTKANGTRARQATAVESCLTKQGQEKTGSLVLKKTEMQDDWGKSERGGAEEHSDAC